jgi:hypothetical protein
MQSGGAPYFQKKAAALEKEIASAEQEAGGNQEELELSFKRVRVLRHALQLAKSYLQLAWGTLSPSLWAVLGSCRTCTLCLQVLWQQVLL